MRKVISRHRRRLQFAKTGKNKAPFFSVIIPVHNQEKLIRQTLDSVFSQRMTDYEVIVVNDGSEDNTSATLEEYGNKIIIIEQDNRGPGHARNTGIAHAKGKYLAFLDSDDLWFPWTLEKIHQAIQQHALPSILVGSHIDIDTDSDVAPVSEKPYQEIIYKDYLESVRDMLWTGTSATFVRKEVLNGSKIFSPMNINSEDNDFMLNLGTAPGFIYIKEPPLFAYRRRTDSRVSEIDRSVAGSFYLILQENSDSYPGGKKRQTDRWYMLGRHIRQVIDLCVKNYRLKDAWKLYYASFKWNIYSSRFRFIARVPLSIFIRLIKKPGFDGVGDNLTKELRTED